MPRSAAAPWPFRPYVRDPRRACGELTLMSVASVALSRARPGQPNAVSAFWVRSPASGASMCQSQIMRRRSTRANFRCSCSRPALARV